MRALSVALLVAFSPAAFADEASTASTNPAVRPAYEGELPPPPVVLKRIRPTFSWDFAVEPSYGQIGYFRDQQPWYVGLGARGGWGRHFGDNRIGFDVHLAVEGPVTVKWSNILEAGVAWDHVTPSGFWAGASVGPSFMLHADLAPQASVAYDLVPALTGFASARIGWSETFTAVGRRLFVGLEPRVRWVAGAPELSFGLAIGSGAGR